MIYIVAYCPQNKHCWKFFLFYFKITFPVFTIITKLSYEGDITIEKNWNLNYYFDGESYNQELPTISDHFKSLFSF